VATGTGLSYQWRKGVVNLTNSGNISGVTTATLTINPVTVIDAATTYNVVVSSSDAADVISNMASLTVNESPVIVTQPADVYVCTGYSASFSVLATGTEITYQWRRGNVNLVNSGTISGATSSVLTINPVTSTDVASDYNVVVSGTCAPAVTSENASLSVSVTTVINTQPANQTECAGNPATFSVTATGAGLTYQWRRGETYLANSGNISGATTATLTVYPTTIADVSNNYNVIIYSECASNVISENASFTMNTAPEITSQPEHRRVQVGSSVSFTVEALGTNLTYQWRRGDVNLINSSTIEGVTTNSFTILVVSESDTAYNYNVVVSGTCAPAAISMNAALSVYDPSGINDFGNVYTSNVVSVYPNPFLNELNIVINEDLHLIDCELFMYNMLGEAVLVTTVTKDLKTLNVSLSSGMYFFKVIEKGKVIQIGKLISQ
jgi:phosphohistidine swiveling domain-containing protein